MVETFAAFLPHVLAGLVLAAAIAASTHAVLYKREVRSTVAWLVFILFVPALGTVLYLVFGINRIRRRARALRSLEREPGPSTCHTLDPGEPVPHPVAPHLTGLKRLLDGIVHQRLVAGNRIELLVDGDQAYPAMLDAIRSARGSVTLSSYIFDNDWAGHRFLEALSGAERRGVAVRCLIDGVGSRYSWPPMPARLHAAGVPVARFLPTLVPWRFPYMNLRNHRKILVVDGTIGFTGSMNIREGCYLEMLPRHPTRDVHARVEGPVVAQLQETFVEDWEFATGEVLEGAPWFVPLEERGPVLARGIPDGPDEHFDAARLTLLGALAVAQRAVLIVTPYFLPDASLITALNVAAMRGVEVDIVLPAKANLVLVQWASRALLWQVLERGCRVWLTPPPFDHAKLMVVDDVWTLVGSANWDPRSLRLNFELNVECYDSQLAATAGALVRERLARARPLSLAEVDARSMPVRLRDGVARLFQPFL